MDHSPPAACEPASSLLAVPQMACGAIACTASKSGWASNVVMASSKACKCLPFTAFTDCTGVSIAIVRRAILLFKAVLFELSVD